MKLEIDFNDSGKSGIKKTFFFNVAQKTLAHENFQYLKSKNISLSFATVSEGEIAKMNATYRKKKSSTDVLSFCEYKNQKEIDKTVDKNIYLGEIILCYNYIKKNAGGGKKNIQKDLAEIVSHGVLHLLGLRHSKKMFAIQKNVAKESALKKIKFIS